MLVLFALLCKRAFDGKAVQETSHTRDGLIIKAAGFYFMECEEDHKHEPHSAGYFG